MIHVTDIPVRFGDLDPAKIVYYPRLLHYVHVAMEETFPKALGKTYAEVVGRDRIGFPSVHLDVDFLATVGYGESLRMSVGVERIGTTSVAFRFEGRRSSDGVLALRAKVVTVVVDMDTFTKREVPAEYRAGLARLVDGPAAEGASRG